MFWHRGCDCLAGLVPSLAVLDGDPFVARRLAPSGAAAGDPLLAHLTPDGVLIEAAEAMDVTRKGGSTACVPSRWLVWFGVVWCCGLVWCGVGCVRVATGSETGHCW